jgi:hypothetical protein
MPKEGSGKKERVERRGKKGGREELTTTLLRTSLTMEGRTFSS